MPTHQIIKQAASLVGIPYQTYMKQVLFERAVTDLSATKAAGLVKA